MITNKTRHLLLITFLLSFTLLSQVKERIYFNSKWEKTTKDKASYYRNLPLEEKEDMVLIKDYYISGAIQFIGWAKKNDETMLLNEVKWFYENGNLKTIGYYLYNHITGVYGLNREYKEYHENGTIYKEENYFIGNLNGKANYYNKQGKLIASCVYEYGKPQEGTTNCFSTYKNGKLIGKKIFYKNTEQLAYEEHHDLSKKHKSYKKYYNKDGEVLKGKKIKFYPSKKCGYVTSIKHIKDIFRSYPLPSNEELFFDKNGKVLYRGIYKYGHPFNGSFYSKDSRLSEKKEFELYYIKTYKGGKIQNLKTYLKDSLFTDGNYVNEKPYNGTFHFITYLNNTQCSVLFTLKNGLKEGKESYYNHISDINTNNAIAYFNYKNGKKEGESNIYYNWEDQNYKMFYKNNEPYEGILKDKKRNIIKFKNGKVVVTKKINWYRDYSYYEIYKDEVKIGIEYDFVDNNKNKIDSGVFKNGKPFSGYFFNTKANNVTLDYYKNGLKKAGLSKKLDDVQFEEIIIDDE
ncbi:hypothetical protein [Tenacibaculum sp.]|uniref:hypothetical protein n=1 Tax=Tenacibaculum sp. TaxID=1906242 RepID=UPI003AA7EC2F